MILFIEKAPEGAFLLLLLLSLDYSENTVKAPPPGAALYLVSSA
jgi:hypothetical protein